MAGEEYLGLAIISFCILYGLLKLAFDLDAEEHYILRMFLQWISVFLLVVISNLGLKIGEAASASADILTTMTAVYYAAIFTMLFTSVYFMIYILKTSMKAATNAGNKNQLRLSKG